MRIHAPSKKCINYLGTTEMSHHPVLRKSSCYSLISLPQDTPPDRRGNFDTYNFYFERKPGKARLKEFIRAGLNENNHGFQPVVGNPKKKLSVA